MGAWRLVTVARRERPVPPFRMRAGRDTRPMYLIRLHGLCNIGRGLAGLAAVIAGCVVLDHVAWVIFC